MSLHRAFPTSLWHQQRPLPHRRAQHIARGHSGKYNPNNDQTAHGEVCICKEASCLLARHQQQTLAAELQLRQKRLAVFLEFEHYELAAAEQQLIHTLLLRQRIAAARNTPAPLYPVGTVVRHRIKAFRGVVVGYDLHCRAPPDWVHDNAVERLPNGQAQPFYHVLCDVRDHAPGEVLYVAQDNVVGVRSPRPIEHPLMEQFFTNFLQGTYIPNHALRLRYPNDV